jgi:hypothetical protein
MGGYMIVDDSMNGVVAGPRFELDLDDVEASSSPTTARFARAAHFAPVDGSSASLAAGATSSS